MKIFSRLRNFSEFAEAGSMGGIALFVSASIAMFAANTDWQETYFTFWKEKVLVGFADHLVEFTVGDTINDFFMAFFFLLVGLEIKRQMVRGELNSLSKCALPAIGAVGGIIVPALTYMMFNFGDPLRANGWAIPVATDIAFALGIVLLLGKKIPVSLRIFLTALAIFDDLVAIVIIGIFYSHNVSVLLIFVAVFLSLMLFVFNRLEVRRLDAYLLVGFAIWLAILGSGLHATLAGVVLAIFVPQRAIRGVSPASRLEKGLHNYVVFWILPLFAFANAGITFDAFSLDEVMKPVSLGVLAGLFVGKPTGVFLSVWLAIAVFGMAKPRGSRWMSILGISFLCGIGFTMSAFLNILAFAKIEPIYFHDAKTGLILGSLMSAVVGTIILSIYRTRPEPEEVKIEHPEEMNEGALKFE